MGIKGIGLQPPGATEADVQKYYAEFGLTPDILKKLIDAQDGVCATCAGPIDGWRGCVDWDPKTRLVRGILCEDCRGIIDEIDERRAELCSH